MLDGVSETSFQVSGLRQIDKFSATFSEMIITDLSLSVHSFFGRHILRVGSLIPFPHTIGGFSAGRLFMDIAGPLRASRWGTAPCVS